jgi:hypothetical protein
VAADDDALGEDVPELWREGTAAPAVSSTIRTFVGPPAPAALAADGVTRRAGGGTHAPL